LLIWRWVWRFPTPNVFEQVPLTSQKALISKFPSVRIHLSEALQTDNTVIRNINHHLMQWNKMFLWQRINRSNHFRLDKMPKRWNSMNLFIFHQLQFTCFGLRLVLTYASQHSASPYTLLYNFDAKNRNQLLDKLLSQGQLQEVSKIFR